jgi:hypothetical protein
MDAVIQHLCDVATMPKSPLKQLIRARVPNSARNAQELGAGRISASAMYQPRPRGSAKSGPRIIAVVKEFRPERALRARGARGDRESD